MSALFARQLRRASGNTIAEVADAFGVSAGFVRRIEAGESGLAIEKIFRLAPDGLRFAADIFDALADVRAANDDVPHPQLTLPGIL